MVERGTWRNLAKLRNLPRQRIDGRHVEIYPCFLCGSQQMQNGIGRAPHGDIQTHRIFKGAAAGDFPRQGCSVILLVPATSQLNN